LKLLTPVLHIINDCPVNKSKGGLTTLLYTSASNSAREWLRRVHCIC